MTSYGTISPFPLSNFAPLFFDLLPPEDSQMNQNGSHPNDAYHWAIRKEVVFRRVAVWVSPGPCSATTSHKVSPAGVFAPMYCGYCPTRSDLFSPPEVCLNSIANSSVYRLRAMIYQHLDLSWLHPGTKPCPSYFSMPSIIVALRPQPQSYQQILALFYARNTFVLHEGNGHSFRWMAAPAIQSIRELTIRVA